MVEEKKVYWLRKDVMRVLGISKSGLQFFERAGAPPYEEGKGGYPAKEFCEFIVQRPRKSKGPDKTKCRELAQKYLLDAIEPARKPMGRPKTNPKTIQKSLLEPGMAKALERAREAEVVAYAMYENGLKQTGIISVAGLDSWQKTLDNLRKCELDFGKVLERNKLLVETKDVQDWLEPMIEQTKTMLLNLPAKLATSLEGLPWHEIQRRLEEEIRDVINKFTNFS